MKTNVKITNIETKEVLFEQVISFAKFEDFADAVYNQVPEEIKSLLDNEFYALPIIEDKELDEEYLHFLHKKYAGYESL